MPGAHSIASKIHAKQEISSHPQRSRFGLLRSQGSRSTTIKYEEYLFMKEILGLNCEGDREGPKDS